MSARFAWVFCAIAFRGWDAMPDRSYTERGARWWARPADAVLSASYRLGCWLYGRAA